MHHTPETAMTAELAQAEARLEAIGADATEDQCERFVSWALEHVGQAHFNIVAEMAAFSGVDRVYTLLRMHAAECGEY